MPKATVDPQTHHYDLSTCEGGWVELRTLSFHEMNTRMDMAARMYQEQKVNPRGRGQQAQQAEQEVRAYLEVMNVAVTEFEFRNCIVDHNLFVDDAETMKIDFTKPMQTWKLDPKIGEEISKYIAQLTQVGDDNLLPLPTAPLSSSSDETTEPSATSLATS